MSPVQAITDSAAVAGAGVIAIGAQTAGVLPENFESWPVTAMLSFLVFACLGIIAYQARTTAKAASEFATNIAGVLKMHEETMKQTKDLTEKLEATNQLMRDTTNTLRNRPCLAQSMP
jgi:hypothetical protein